MAAILKILTERPIDLKLVWYSVEQLRAILTFLFRLSSVSVLTTMLSVKEIKVVNSFQVDLKMFWQKIIWKWIGSEKTQYTLVG